jgi:hypothetical protein
MSTAFRGLPPRRGSSISFSTNSCLQNRSDAFLTNYLIETITRGYGNDSFEAEAYGFESTVASTTVGLQSVEVEQAQAVAEVLGGCPKLVIQNKAAWANVSKSFRNCVAGKESMDAAGRGVKIRKQDCVAAITAKYNLAGSFAICEAAIPTLGGGKSSSAPATGGESKSGRKRRYRKPSRRSGRHRAKSLPSRQQG